MNSLTPLLAFTILFSTNKVFTAEESKTTCADDVAGPDWGLVSNMSLGEDTPTARRCFQFPKLPCFLTGKIISYLAPNPSLHQHNALSSGLIPHKNYSSWEFFNTLTAICPRNVANWITVSTHFTAGITMTDAEIAAVQSLLEKAFSLGYKIVTQQGLDYVTGNSNYAMGQDVSLGDIVVDLGKEVLCAVRRQFSCPREAQDFFNHINPSQACFLYFDILHALLHGATANNLNGSIFLGEACSRHNLALLKLLLTFKADPNKPHNGYYPLGQCPATFPFIRTLVEHGADINIATNDAGQTILHRVCEGDRLWHTYPKNIDQTIATAQFLLRHGAIASPDMITNENSLKMRMLIKKLITEQCMATIKKNVIFLSNRLTSESDIACHTAESASTLPSLATEDPFFYDHRYVIRFFEEYKTLMPLVYHNTTTSAEDLEQIYQLLQTSTTMGIDLSRLLEQYTYAVVPAALQSVRLSIDTPEEAEEILSISVSSDEYPVLFFILLRALLAGANPSMLINGVPLLSILKAQNDHLSIMLLHRFGLTRETPSARDNSPFEPIEEEIREHRLPAQTAPRRSAKDRCII